MINLTSLILFIIPFFILIIFLNLFHRQNIPKGLKELPKVPGWPFVGVMFSYRKPLFLYLYQLIEKHGSIFKFTMGSHEIIVLNTFPVIEKALKEMGNTFSGRWKSYIKKKFHRNCGIFVQELELWEIQRKFVMKELRNFGLGKSSSQEIINYETSHLLKEIEEGCHKVIDTKSLFSLYTINVIAKLVANKRFEKDDLNFKSMTKFMEDIAQSNKFCVSIVEMFPILENIPFINNILLKVCGRSDGYETIFTHIKDIINEHEKRFEPSNEGDDLIDIYLKEKYELKLNDVKNHSFTDDQTIIIVYELFIAGYETTFSTLSWSMLLMARNMKIQEKVFNEIKIIIGLNRYPELTDKKNLTYTQAVIDEIFRYSSVVPLSVPHKVLENTEINGYFIPKYSIVFPNIYAVHHDTNIWEKPFDFYPEHFLKEINGETKYVSRINLMPFGIGKRQCLGELLARMEFFTFFTSILQRFRIKLLNPMSDDEFNRITIGTNGIIRAPLFTEIVFEMLDDY